MLKAAEYIPPERGVPYAPIFLGLTIVVPVGFMALLIAWSLVSERSEVDSADVPSIMGP